MRVRYRFSVHPNIPHVAVHRYSEETGHTIVYDLSGLTGTLVGPVNTNHGYGFDTGEWYWFLSDDILQVNGVETHAIQVSLHAVEPLQ